MKNTLYLFTAVSFYMAIPGPAHAQNSALPDLLGDLLPGDVQHLTVEEAAGTRGESMKKEASQYGYCGLRRCTRMFVNDKHLYTIYEDGSVYFVKY